MLIKFSPLVSVIIPFYRNASEIKRSLSSVFNQTYQNFEILIINDASPDWYEAMAIINTFDQDQLRIISYETKKNGSAARNMGIKAARGDLIAFLDADDEWYPDHLKNAITFQSKNHYDLISCKVKIINQNGVYYSPKFQKSEKESLATYLFVKGMSMYTPSICCRREVAQMILFDESLRRHQDFDFLLRVENANYKLGTSPHLGSVVHWENNDTIKKGETWQFSLEWLKNRKRLFTKKEYDNFWMQFVGFKILKLSKSLFISEFIKNKINILNINRSRIRKLMTFFFK